MIRLGSLFRVEFQDGPFKNVAYFVCDTWREAESAFTSSRLWDGTTIIVISKHLDDVYGVKNE